MLCRSHIRIWNLANHMKQKWNKKHQTLSLQFFTNRSSILKLLFFSCGSQDFKFSYVNRKAFSARFLYWVYFTISASPSSLTTICHSFETLNSNWLYSADTLKRVLTKEDFLSVTKHLSLYQDLDREREPLFTNFP